MAVKGGCWHLHRSLTSLLQDGKGCGGNPQGPGEAGRRQTWEKKVGVDHIRFPVASRVKPLPVLEDGPREASLTVDIAVSEKKRHSGMN